MNTGITRRIQSLSKTEIKEILYAITINLRADVCAKHNISLNTLHRLEENVAKSASDSEYNKIQRLKEAGLNSLEVAEELKMDLARVNKLWN